MRANYFEFKQGSIFRSNFCEIVVQINLRMYCIIFIFSLLVIFGRIKFYAELACLFLICNECFFTCLSSEWALCSVVTCKVTLKTCSQCKFSSPIKQKNLILYKVKACDLYNWIRPIRLGLQILSGFLKNSECYMRASMT